MTQFGQYPAPQHVIAHISDTHFPGGTGRLYGTIDTRENLLLAIRTLERSGIRPEAIVFTGDLADLGAAAAYRELRAIVEPAAERMGSQVIWVMGNHDERLRFATELLDIELLNTGLPAAELPAAEPSDTGFVSTTSGTASDTASTSTVSTRADFTAHPDGCSTRGTAPLDRVHEVGGLRIIAIDTTVPGYHHGEITDAQLAWLADVLRVPASHGTLLALHHPPIPTPVEVMAILELRDQERLADVIQGTDVRGILGGHLHYSTHSTFAGVPVSVAAATCYTLDLGAPAHVLSGIDGGRSFNLVQVYEDRLVHCVVPVVESAVIAGFDERYVAAAERMSPEERLEAFSSKRSTFRLPG